jgi:hypothetical protein
LKKYLLFFLLVIPVLSIAQVSIKDTTISWHTFKYSLNADNTVASSSTEPNDTVSVTFHGYVLENEYLKIILVPEYGGRILSMIYKPTGHEELYQNPVGSPYGVGQGWFYYNWLMVYGGIFPTLPEPEHGKAWFLPWEFEIVKNTPDTVRCNMTWRDTVMSQSTYSQSFSYGLTNIKCDFTLTLVRGASALESDITLLNDADVPLDYEYWTCLTLAPGSEPGNPKTTGGAEIISSTKTIKIPSWYPDIAKQEKKITGQSGIYTFDKLHSWTNWTNDGIAYAWDENKSNYWGVINHDNREGVIRVADNSNNTPGLKMWAWGYSQSQNIDYYANPLVVRRPYIELWAGNSKEFFASANFEANSEKKWKEIYFPTVGLSNVTHANNEIVADFKIGTSNTSLAAEINFITAHPNNNFNVSLEITGQNPQIIFNQSVVPDPLNGNNITVNLPTNQTWISGDSLICKIEDSNEGNILTASISLNNITTDINEFIADIPKDFNLFQNYPNPFNPETIISFNLVKRELTTLKIYDILGREVAVLVNEVKNAGNYKIALNASSMGLSSGIYFYKLSTPSYSLTRKMAFLK